MTRDPAPQSEIKKPRKSRRRVEVNGRIKVAHRRAKLMGELERNPAVTMPELAELFKVSESTVMRDMIAIATFYRKRAGDSREVWLGRMLQHYDAIYGKAELGWQKSLEDRVVKTERAGGEGGGYSESKREGQSGNPSFLAEQNKALAAQAKLLGLDAPTKVHTSVSLEASVMPEFAGLVVRILSEVGAPPEAIGRFVSGAKTIIMRLSGGAVDAAAQASIGYDGGDEDGGEGDEDFEGEGESE